MAQTVGQFYEIGGKESESTNSYMIPKTDGSLINIVRTDSGTVRDVALSFENPCLQFSQNLDSAKSYYLHIVIKRLKTDQTFNIRLAFSDSTKEVTQFLRKVDIVQMKTENQKNGEVEIVFQPNEAFDRIIFELERNIYDLESHVDPVTGETIYGRTPYIAAIEVSEIVNRTPVSVPISKIGVQSRPDLMMCINGEEMHLPRSGIFELRDGIVKITFFSVVKAGTLKNASKIAEYEAQLNRVQSDPEMASINFTADDKDREIYSYTLDYMYNSGD